MEINRKRYKIFTDFYVRYQFRARRPVSAKGHIKANSQKRYEKHTDFSSGVPVVSNNAFQPKAELRQTFVQENIVEIGEGPGADDKQENEDRVSI